MLIVVLLILPKQVFDMIVEEYKREQYTLDTSISTNRTTLMILELMKMAAVSFKAYLAFEYHTKQNLNEPDFSQTYLQQATKLIRRFDYPFNIDKEYQDIYLESKGFSDLYFYTNAEEKSNVSIFSIECKRLPTLETCREKEYVIGNKSNGGIERYKTEKHGKGLPECGMVGFVEKETFTFWFQNINTWILDLSTIGSSFWQADEKLETVESTKDFMHLKSIAHRKSQKDIRLQHLWIDIS